MDRTGLTPSLRLVALCTLLVSAPAALADTAAETTSGREVAATLERLRGERRVVLSYLDHDNPDLALTALDRWRAAAGVDGERLLALAPMPSELRRALAALDAALNEAAQAIERGDGARARASVEAAVDPLDAWRREAWRRDGGLTLFSDCIADLTRRYAALDRFRRAGPDLDAAATRAEVGAAAADVIAAVTRCDAQAGAAVRVEPEFRRLTDGMSASLARIPAAVDARDPALLHRLLIELRAFERLLAFRYG